MASRISDLTHARAHARAVAPAPAPPVRAHVAALRFALPHASEGSLCVLDAQDHVVRTLLSPTLPAGELHATWDGLDDTGRVSPRGTYRLRLDVDGRTVTTRLVELR